MYCIRLGRCGGDGLSFEINLRSAAAMSAHTLRMNVFDPDGNESEPYSRNIRAESGKASGILSLALNEKKGQWNIHVTDVTSGRQTAVTFVIE